MGSSNMGGPGCQRFIAGHPDVGARENARVGGYRAQRLVLKLPGGAPREGFLSPPCDLAEREGFFIGGVPPEYVGQGPSPVHFRGSGFFSL